MIPGTQKSSSHNEREKMLSWKRWEPSAGAIHDPKCWRQFPVEMSILFWRIRLIKESWWHSAWTDTDFQPVCEMYRCSRCVDGPELFSVGQSLPYLRTKSLFSYVICLIFTCSDDVRHEELNAKTYSWCLKMPEFHEIKTQTFRDEALPKLEAQLTEAGCFLPHQNISCYEEGNKTESRQGCSI